MNDSSAPEPHVYLEFAIRLSLKDRSSMLQDYLDGFKMIIWLKEERPQIGKDSISFDITGRKEAHE